MNKLEEEIIVIIDAAPKPISVQRITELSKITKHERRIHNSVLSLVDKKIVLLSSSYRQNYYLAKNQNDDVKMYRWGIH